MSRAVQKASAETVAAASHVQRKCRSKVVLYGFETDEEGVMREARRGRGQWIDGLST